MNLKELQFPVRAYWDLPVLNSSVEQMSVCQELIRNRVLSIHIEVPELHAGDAAIGLLQRLDREQIAVLLTIPGEPAALSVIRLLQRFKIAVLFFRVSSLHNACNLLTQIRQCEPIISDRSTMPISLGISFEVSNSNFTELPSLVSLCAGQGIKDFVIPIQRLSRKRECFYLTGEMRSMLAEKLQGINTTQLRLAIHDPFLWRAFSPSVSLPAAGCEAANSIFYISADGDVYPCPSLPLKLGNIHNHGLANILSCSAKKALRKTLSSAPRECSGCSEVGKCMGGCRGRALVLKGSLDFADPACNISKSF